MRGSSSRSTYLPITSASRFTLLPGPSSPRFVFARVWGSIETVKEPSPTDTSVRLMPSTQMLPFSTQKRSTASGAWNSQISASPSGLNPSTRPTPSTCPCTMCPPNLPPADIARSRLTGLPAARPPSAVRLSVSGMAKKLSVRPSTSPTVRQAPFTQTLSPACASSEILTAEMLRRSISPPSSDETRPTSSTSPVNTFLLSARVERYDDIIPYLPDLRDRELQRLRYLRRPERPDHGHALRTEELRRVEKGQLVGKPPADKARRRLAPALDEKTLYPTSAQLFQYVHKVEALLRKRRRNDLDAEPLQLYLATVGPGGEDDDGRLFRTPREPALRADRQAGI